MKPLTTQGKLALHYIINTGGTATVAQFDDDHEPIGSLLREDLKGYLEVNFETKKLSLTQAGKDALK